MSNIENKEKQLTGYPHIDKPWLQYYDTEFDEKNIPNMSIYQLVEQWNKENLENIAIDMRTSKKNFEKGIKITYDEYLRRMKKSAKSSKELGFKTDEIIPILLPNIPEARILIYSNSILGSTSYPISPMLAPNELLRIINENGIKNIFVFEGFYEKFADCLNKANLENIIMLNGTESLPKGLRELKKLREMLTNSGSKYYKLDRRIVPWDEYDKSSKYIKGDITPYYNDGHIAAIIGTSGTTGTSKGVCLTDRNINSVACMYKDGKILEGTFLDALLPSIGYGISMIHYQTANGKYVYLIPELLTTKFPEALSTIKPDNFPGGPVHYLNLRDSNLFKNNQIPEHKNLISGGASLPKDVELELNKIDENYEENGIINENIVVRQGYALSESVAAATYSKRGTYKFGSIGIPMPYVTISIFEPGTDNELMYNQQGEICITGPNVMEYYLNNKEETDKVIKVHKDGKRWIHTQDIGYMDENGHIFHIDRIKNIFMRTGFNVHPSKIGEFINTIPIVKTSAVVGFEHPEEQCVPIAFIVLNENLVGQKTDDEIKEIIAEYCYKNLEETSIPYDYVITDELPINVGGKIDLKRLKEESGIDLMKNDIKIKKRINFKG